MNAFDRGKVERFATLPPGEAYPEGIDADAEGNVYVVTVGANKPDTSPGSPPDRNRTRCMPDKPAATSPG